MTENIPKLIIDIYVVTEVSSSWWTLTISGAANGEHFVKMTTFLLSVYTYKDSLENCGIPESCVCFLS